MALERPATKPSPAVEPPPSAHLTAAISKGDEAAFGAFYELWFDRVFAIARSLTRRDEAFCLDVVQDCMMRVVKSMPALSSEEAVSAWMGRTAFSTAIDRIRGDDRRVKRERAASIAERVDPPEPDEHAAWLRARLAELPPAERDLLMDRFEGKGTLRSLGAARGISGNAAHGRISRILNRLRRAAAEFFDD